MSKENKTRYEFTIIAKKMSACFKVFIITISLLGCACHPQCLDYRPPFKPEPRLSFCDAYTSYSCCTTSKDAALQSDYHYAMRTAGESQTKCKEFLKDLLCLECHPYAAHVFDAELPSVGVKFDKRNVDFPGLCKNFCLQVFNECKPLLLMVVRSDSFYSFMKNSSADEFCDWARLQDENYCYPDVNSVGKELVQSYENTLPLCVESVGGSFANPLAGVHSKDGTHRMFIAEQRGIVYILDHIGRKKEKPFLNITERIINSGVPWDERGLLGLEFHPRYRENGRFYVYYSSPNDKVQRMYYSEHAWYWKVNHKVRLSEFTVSRTNPNEADHNSELVLLDIDQPEFNHNGGMILFGLDNYLYVFPGDGGGAGDLHGSLGHGLNMSTLMGKVLRIDVDSENKLYAIPLDNPFLKYNNVRPEIYAFGLRNAWRCSVDRGTVNNAGSGRMFCGDVGQNRFEEIDIIEKGGNYGWKAYEGFSCFDIKLCRQKIDNLKFPIITYNHSVGQSVVGGYVYRGCSNPRLHGKYLYADTMNGKIFAAEETNGTWVIKQVVMGNSSICNNGLVENYHKNILSFGESESGELYILSTFHPEPRQQFGAVYRLVDPALRGAPDKCNFNVQTPASLPFKRRQVYNNSRKKTNKIQPTKQMKPICLDQRPYICRRYFQPYNGKKPAIKCASAKSYAIKYCRKTCTFCI